MSCFVFHQGFKHSKTIKTLGLRPRTFISFLVFETPMKHSHLFLKYYLKCAGDSGGREGKGGGGWREEEEIRSFPLYAHDRRKLLITAV